MKKKETIDLLMENGEISEVNELTLSLYYNTLWEQGLTHEDIRHGLDLPQIWTQDEVYAEFREMSLTGISNWLEDLKNNVEVMVEVDGKLEVLYNQDLVDWLGIITWKIFTI